MISTASKSIRSVHYLTAPAPVTPTKTKTIQLQTFTPYAPKVRKHTSHIDHDYDFDNTVHHLEFFTEFDTHMLNKELGLTYSSNDTGNHTDTQPVRRKLSWADSVEEEEANGTHVPLSQMEILEMSMSMHC